MNIMKNIFPNILLFIYVLHILFKLSSSKTLNYLRKISESSNPNLICMKIIDNDLYDFYDLKDEDIIIYGNLQIKFCDNIENYQSSVIYKTNEKVYRLAGNINGEGDNKNQIIIKDNNIVEFRLAYGDDFKTDKKYQVTIEFHCKEDTKIKILRGWEDFIPEKKKRIKYCCRK